MMFNLSRSTVSRRFFSITRTFSKESTTKNNILLDSLDHAMNITQTMGARKTNTILPRLEKEFNAGETYDPFDFSIAKLNLEKKQQKMKRANEIGVFDKKKLNPLHYYISPKDLSDFVSSTGRIQPRDVTKLTVKNQKRLAKAIKRSRAVGLLSSVRRDLSTLEGGNNR